MILEATPVENARRDGRHSRANYYSRTDRQRVQSGFFLSPPLLFHGPGMLVVVPRPLRPAQDKRHYVISVDGRKLRDVCFINIARFATPRSRCASLAARIFTTSLFHATRCGSCEVVNTLRRAISSFRAVGPLSR